MYKFHVSVHAQPIDASPGPVIRLGDLERETLDVPRGILGQAAIACTFEAALQALRQLARMYCEPDGSLVWVSRHDEPSWQVDGNLYDRDGSLIFVDLRGSCPAEEFDRLLACFGWPKTKLMFQLVREAVFLDEAQFRKYAEEEGSRQRAVGREAESRG